MKCLVTGSAGFLGSNLVEKLKKYGHEVIGWDISEGKDVCNVNLNEVGLDAIFHLACPVDPGNREAVALKTVLASSVGTYNMINLASGNHAKFLYVSSSEVYGSSDEAVTEETRGNTSQIDELSHYTESKRFGEMLTMLYHRYYGLDARIVRPFNVYGPGMRKDDSRVIPSFFRRKKENLPLVVNDSGTSTRTFCYVDDFIEGLIRAMFYENTNGEVFNIGSDVPMTMVELAKLISPDYSIVESTRKDEPKYRRPDISKAKRVLQWEPKMGLKEGLELMWKNYL